MPESGSSPQRKVSSEPSLKPIAIDSLVIRLCSSSLPRTQRSTA